MLLSASHSAGYYLTESRYVGDLTPAQFSFVGLVSGDQISIQSGNGMIERNAASGGNLQQDPNEIDIDVYRELRKPDSDLNAKIKAELEAMRVAQSDQRERVEKRIMALSGIDEEDVQLMEQMQKQQSESNIIL